MRRLLAVLVALAALAIASPAMADEFAPGAPVATPVGYAGPAVYAMWAAPASMQLQVYAPADRRWGARRVLRTLNLASRLQLVLTTTPCNSGCITIRDSSDPAAFAVHDTPEGRGVDRVGGFADIKQTDGVMQQCDVMLNRTMFNRKWPASNWMTTAHEVEHCLGLSHTTEAGTVLGVLTDGMVGPSALDLEWIGQLYGVLPARW